MNKATSFKIHLAKDCRAWRKLFHFEFRVFTPPTPTSLESLELRHWCFMRQTLLCTEQRIDQIIVMNQSKTRSYCVMGDSEKCALLTICAK